MAGRDRSRTGDLRDASNKVRASNLWATTAGRLSANIDFHTRRHARPSGRFDARPPTDYALTATCGERGGGVGRGRPACTQILISAGGRPGVGGARYPQRCTALRTATRAALILRNAPRATLRARTTASSREPRQW